MSFSSNIKNELLNIFNNTTSNIAEFSAIIGYCSKFHENSLVISSENILLITKALRLIDKIFNIHLDIIVEDGKSYKLIINNQIYINTIFKVINPNNFKCITKNLSVNNLTTDSLDKNLNDILNNNIKHKLEYNSLNFSDICSKRAYIRASFICAGYISNPSKNYHLEFINHSYEQAQFLKSIINDFEIYPKIIEKKDNFILYIKESEQISELLNIIEAHKALIEFENIRILKDVRNNVNRTVNCETANLSKVISASVSHINDIEYIKSHIGLDNLPLQLKEIAILRTDNPDASLYELSLLTNPHIGKSGVNHRLKKLNSIAENLRRKKT